MSRFSLTLVVCASALVACGDDTYELFVDLRTDMAPGVEFDNTVVELRDARGRLGAVVRSTEEGAISSHDYSSGRRVAELVGLRADDYVLRVELELESTAIVDVIVPITISGDRAETVFVTRACIERTCPRAGDDPTAVGCLHGACVDPQCLLGRGSGCGTPMDGGIPDSGVDTGTLDSRAPDGDVVDSAVTDADATTDASSCPMAGDLTPAVDQCTSGEDRAALARMDYGDMMDQTLLDLAYGCASSCLGGTEGCIATCVRTGSDLAVSVECAPCYELLVSCALRFCLGSCILPDSPACMECIGGMNGCMFNCSDELDLCTGVIP